VVYSGDFYLGEVHGEGKFRWSDGEEWEGILHRGEPRATTWDSGGRRCVMIRSSIEGQHGSAPQAYQLPQPQTHGMGNLGRWELEAPAADAQSWKAAVAALTFAGTGDT